MHDTVAYETFFVGTIDYSREIDMFLGSAVAPYWRSVYVRGVQLEIFVTGFFVYRFESKKYCCRQF